MSSLFVVPTPIGNLGDITIRAIDILKKVDFILAEDTRTSKILLNHYNIETPIFSFHLHNEHKVVTKYINEMQNGKTIALISDAGTPSISDPGYLLVRAAIDNHILVQCLPGATALIPALVVSGFGCESFTFLGFLPVKKGRKTSLQNIAQSEITTVFYESPHRIIKLIDEMMLFFEPTRQICIVREISKKFEETLRGDVLSIQQLLKAKTLKGEMVVIVSPNKKNKKNHD